MDFEKEIYEIEFTEDSKEEIKEIYEYISVHLVAENAAKRLMKKMRNNVMNLAKTPRIYEKINRKNKRDSDFRKMVVDNYVVLYTIDEEKKIIYIAHMYYSGKNYLYE